MEKQELEDFKNRILFDQIHMTERSEKFSQLCQDIDFHIRHGKRIYGSIQNSLNDEKLDSPYMCFLKLASGVIQREKLIALCQDLKGRTDWKSLHYMWNDGDENYYQDHFQREIDLAKKLMKKLRPFVLEYTKSWTGQRKQMDLDRPEGRFLKGWYLAQSTEKLKSKLN